ncbi:MAG: GntR family transcriptional regulator [bacterium]
MKIDKSHAVPRYFQLKEILKKHIIEGEWKPGERISSQPELARKYDVSLVTVNRAVDVLVKNGYLISEVGVGTFVNDPKFWHMGDEDRWGIKDNRLKSSLIGVIFSPIILGNRKEGVPAHYWNKVFVSMTERAEELGYHLVNVFLSYGDLESLKMPSILMGDEVEGLILAHRISHDRYISMLQRFNLPMVFVHYDDFEIPNNYSGAVIVTNDNECGIGKLIDYLVNLGHRRIAFVGGGMKEGYCSERLSAYRSSLARHGLEPAGVRVSDQPSTILLGRDLMDELLESGCEFTAVVASCDIIAIGAIKSAKRHKLRVPDDISIVGHDDIEISEHLDPPLTTIRADREWVGRTAVDKLVQMIRGGGVGVRKIVSPRAELIVRDSCKAPAGEMRFSGSLTAKILA